MSEFRELGAQVMEELGLQLVARREIRMAPFARKGMVRLAVPVHPGLAQAGAHGDDRAIARGPGRPLIQGDKVPGRERGDAVGIGLQIVDKPDGPQT